MSLPVIELKHKWHLGTKMDQGGFGSIYEARGENDESVVVKLVPKAPRASREIRFESLSGTAHIIPILDSGEWENHYVLVMPRAEKSLRQHLDEAKGKLTTDDAISILIDVAEALDNLYRGVVHRDLKPQNVLLYQGHWCLADFGIARYAEEITATNTNKRAKTPQYAAPEQWREEHANWATDVYAFGVMAFELLQGHRPFPGPSPADFHDQHLNRTPPALEGCAPAVASLVTECLGKTQGSRPTPSNILARLRRSRVPASLATTKLQAVNDQNVRKQSLANTQISAQKTVAERRADLFAVAEQKLSGVAGQLTDRILEAASLARVTRQSATAVQLDKGVLIIGRVAQAPPDCLAANGDRGPFDVIAYTSITARKPLDRYGYEGRSHSLWFCDAHDAGIYRWFETAFMAILTREIPTFDPFALNPPDKEAIAAFSRGTSHRQVAWQPLPFDQGDEEQFIERWLEWFAEASAGTLSRPSPLPENSGGRFRRGGS